MDGLLRVGGAPQAAQLVQLPHEAAVAARITYVADYIVCMVLSLFQNITRPKIERWSTASPEMDVALHVMVTALRANIRVESVKIDTARLRREVKVYGQSLYADIASIFMQHLDKFDYAKPLDKEIFTNQILPETAAFAIQLHAITGGSKKHGPVPEKM